VNPYLVSAASLLALVGLVHTVLGEVLIFRRMRTAGVIPTHGGDVLRERHVRILWATWHAVSVFAWGASLMLWEIGNAPASTSQHGALLFAIALSSLGSAMLVLIGTRARHPGWIGLLVVALLTWLGGTA